MSNWRKVFQGLIILAIFFGVLGAIAGTALGSGQSLAHPALEVILANSGNPSYTGITTDAGQVFWASVAWNRGAKCVQGSVAWN